MCMSTSPNVLERLKLVRIIGIDFFFQPNSFVSWCHSGKVTTIYFQVIFNLLWVKIGSELFSLLTCLHTTTFTLLSIFSPLEVIRVKIWETPLSWHAKCSLPVAVRVSKTRVLKLPIKIHARTVVKLPQA